jgi:hypothetical protein
MAIVNTRSPRFRVRTLLIAVAVPCVPLGIVMTADEMQRIGRAYPEVLEIDPL